MKMIMRVALIAGLALGTIAPGGAYAQGSTPPKQETVVPTPDYTLGAGDEINVSVWLHPELERKVSIGKNGSVVLPPLGEVPAAGLTTKQLGERLSERLSTYLRQTTTVTVAVSQYKSRNVNVTGAVSNPGSYGFETIPSLVDALNTAGGGLPGADLARVQIIRAEGADRGTTSADVLTAQRSGTTESLPKLKPGDTVFVPSTAGGAFAPAPTDGFAVLGEVGRPGIYQSAGSTTIWMALAQAGGLTQVGDLAHIKIVNISPEGQQVTELNLKDVLQRGGPTAALVRPGDVVFIPHTRASVAAKAWVGLTQALAVSADLVNIVIIADYLNTR